jgi:hypothetical protein
MIRETSPRRSGTRPSDVFAASGKELRDSRTLGGVNDLGQVYYGRAWGTVPRSRLSRESQPVVVT